MYTEPKIITSDDLSKRSYITFYFNDERIREYNGKSIGLRLEPNRSNTIAERNLILRKLQFELYKALESFDYPKSADTTSTLLIQESQLLIETTEYLLKNALYAKMNSSLSRTYKRDLKSILNEFIKFLSAQELSSPLDEITTARLDAFLLKFGSSGTYYMNKRRNLSVLFSAAGKMIDKPIKTVKETSRRKAKSKLHEAYDKEQLLPIFKFLERTYPKLWLCCLITYGAWLRPHEEIRLLTPGNFKKNATEIHLSGDENKSGRVRAVYLPDYVQDQLHAYLDNLEPHINIFSRTVEPLNYSYFNTMWSRAKKKMIAKGLLKETQTLYSFRHTAAVDLYRRTKDVYLIQKVLGHSNIVVTLKYLRSLGEFNSEELKAAAPTL